MYLECIQRIPNHDVQKEAKAQDLAIHLKSDLLELLNTFVEKYGNTMAGLDYYTSYYTLQAKIADACEEFQRQTRLFRQYILLQKTSNDIRDQLKQCPNCGLIWLRVEGCQNTNCGNTPSSIWDFFRNIIYSYQIKRVGGRIQIGRKNPIPNKHANEQTGGNNTDKSKKRLGCGHPMNFNALPRLPNIEEIINTWYQAANKQELIERMKNDKDMTKIQQEAETIVTKAVR